MSPPPHPRLAPPTYAGTSSSPFRSYNYYQEQDPEQSSSQDSDQFTLKQEPSNETMDLFRSQAGSSGSYGFDPSTQLDSDADLVVPATRNDMIYNTQGLQYPPKYDLHSGQFAGMPSQYAQLPQQFGPQYEHYPVNQQMIQEQFQSQNLYPAMTISPTLVDQDIPLGVNYGQIPPSFSSTTVSSLESMPQVFLPTMTNKQNMTSSQSDNSLASSMSFQNLEITPRRPVRRPSFTGNVNVTPGQFTALHRTPNQSLKRTPSARVTKSHRRTRSRLSVDATGTAILGLPPSNSTNNLRSPGPNVGGTNPFYTPNVYQQDSPSVTPLATPQADRRDHSSFASISPMMLMHPNGKPLRTSAPNEELSSDVFAEAANMTLRLASHYAYSSGNDTSNTGSSRQHRRSESAATFPTTQSFLTDPNNTELNELTEATTNSTDTSTRSHSTASSTPLTHQRTKSTTAVPPSNMSRSQSAFDLASLSKSNPKLIPPEITKYDIITPRKPHRMQKSQSSTDLASITAQKPGKKARKMHNCPLCSAAFQRPEHVKRHMRSHSSEKPFVCDQPNCGKRFNRGDNMKAHLRKIHGLDV